MWDYCCVVVGAALFMWGLIVLVDKLEGINHEFWSRQWAKTLEAHNEMEKARYESLGVQCHGHCFLFGCKYERITDELHGLGVEQGAVERLVETLNDVPHRQPCDCGKALLPISTTPPNHQE